MPSTVVFKEKSGIFWKNNAYIFIKGEIKEKNILYNLEYS